MSEGEDFNIERTPDPVWKANETQRYIHVEMVPLTKPNITERAPSVSQQCRMQ